MAYCYLCTEVIDLRSARTRGLVPCNKSPEEFTQRDWSQGLVPRTVHTKRLEEQDTGTQNGQFTRWDLSEGLVAGASALVCADLNNG